MTHDEDENLDESTETSSDSGDKRSWSEMMRELTVTGLAAFFMTEDSVRGYLKEKKLPKELVSLFIDSFAKKKDDFYGIFAKELGKVLAKIDISREVSRFLEKHKIHFEAKISFEPKHGHETQLEQKGKS